MNTSKMIPPMRVPEQWAGAASTILSFFFILDMIRRWCPPELYRRLTKFLLKLDTYFYPSIQVSIHEFTGSNLRLHEAYPAVEAYLSVNSSKTVKKLKAEMVKDRHKLVFTMDEDERVIDEFQGVKMTWISGKTRTPQGQGGPGTQFSGNPEPERRHYRLVFHKRYRELVFGPYLEHVIKTGKEICRRNRQRKLFTNGHHRSSWSYILFDHPATFETLAMEPEKKAKIIEDLLTFKDSKDFYARIGKAWKRGYLLYGPPGTGKSTMIAAMANLLEYDIYDLELTSVAGNTELRRLLTETTGKSIIVIEDIDCSLDLTGQRKKVAGKNPPDVKKDTGKSSKSGDKGESSGTGTGSKVTLSGLLNFIDGLWSACCGERIIVFTTNHADKLDPALTRRGRMDMHIELSYCSFEAFKVLAMNYLQLEDHPLFQSIRNLMEVTEITPADVAESLMPKSPDQDAERSLRILIQALQEAKEKQEAEEKQEAKKEVKENECDKVSLWVLLSKYLTPYTVFHLDPAIGVQRE
ncbi:AAA-ATPase At3g28580-like [Coffea arabica]|uniref:AAA-ATPase At3g28580-like n=1 Tax=Coffea arabica TaxID=13443 RepID=A0A6P6XEZ4_COFAR|nr:AAA-ATPase At3g28580-like [Coffea arabica]